MRQEKKGRRSTPFQNTHVVHFGLLAPNLAPERLHRLFNHLQRAPLDTGNLVDALPTKSFFFVADNGDLFVGCGLKRK